MPVQDHLYLRVRTADEFLLSGRDDADQPAVWRDVVGSSRTRRTSLQAFWYGDRFAERQRFRRDDAVPNSNPEVRGL